jgi:hypothetical protein
LSVGVKGPSPSITEGDELLASSIVVVFELVPIPARKEVVKKEEREREKNE